MNGQSKNYFSKEEKEIDSLIKLMDKLYINTDFNANQFRDLLNKILKEYNFDAIEFKVFFRSDFKTRHEAEDYIKLNS